MAEQNPWRPPRAGSGRSAGGGGARKVAGGLLRVLGKVFLGLLLIAVIGIGLIFGICTLMQ